MVTTPLPHPDDCSVDYPNLVNEHLYSGNSASHHAAGIKEAIPWTKLCRWPIPRVIGLIAVVAVIVVVVVFSIILTRHSDKDISPKSQIEQINNTWNASISKGTSSTWHASKDYVHLKRHPVSKFTVDVSSSLEGGNRRLKWKAADVQHGIRPDVEYRNGTFSSFLGGIFHIIITLNIDTYALPAKGDVTPVNLCIQQLPSEVYRPKCNRYRIGSRRTQTITLTTILELCPRGMFKITVNSLSNIYLDPNLDRVIICRIPRS